MSCGSQARLSLDTQHKGLVEIAQQLSAKASLLDSAQLDHIEGRITALTQKMDSINEKSAATPEEAERNHKVHNSRLHILCSFQLLQGNIK
jgi:dynactin-2